MANIASAYVPGSCPPPVFLNLLYSYVFLNLIYFVYLPSQCRQRLAQINSNWLYDKRDCHRVNPIWLSNDFFLFFLFSIRVFFQDKYHLTTAPLAVSTFPFDVAILRNGYDNRDILRPEMAPIKKEIG